jgi:threonine dehydrogenase-like Zn-dependent dehydrogenase
MKALRVFEGDLSVKEIAKPIAAGEALIRVVKSGICNTDLEIARGYAGFNGTLGHEFVGVVEEGSDSRLIGKRVVGEINAGCGKCEHCVRGDARHCPERTVLGIRGRDGTHAEFLCLPSVNLIEVPEFVSDESAVFVEPLAAAFGITEQVQIGPDDRIAVIGDGKLGILCSRSLSHVTRDLMHIGKHRKKLDLAEKYGNVTGVLADDASALQKSFDIVIEASGSESGFNTALNLLKPRGKMVLKSTFHGSPRWDAAHVVVDEITIIGSRCGRFAPALELLSTNAVEVKDLITDEIPLSRGVEAMKLAAELGVMKVLLSN